MQTYHIYIFDYYIGAIFHINTDTIVYTANAVDDNGDWNFEVLLRELGFTSNIEYLASKEPLHIVDL